MGDYSHCRRGRREGRPSTAQYVDPNGGIALPDGITLTTLIDRNAAEFGDDLAYRFVDYSQHSEGRAAELTWRQVAARTRAIAARLQQVTSPDDRVAILAPQGLDYVTGFFGALQAGNIAVPLFAPEFPGHAERLEAVLTDARPSVILTTTAAAAAIGKFVRMMPRADRPRTIAVDEVPDSVGATFTPANRQTDDVAYLQYSSGSTRVPTGVEITHRAAGTNLLQMILTMDLEGDYDMNGVSWLPLYHDMGLMMICFPVLDASHLTLMSPVAFVRRPQRWIQVLSAESRDSHIVSPAPNFAFDLVVQRGIPRGEIDLSDVILINGSEPVHIGSVQTFTETFLSRGLSKSAIRPSYGMAEATLFVSSIRPGTEPFAVYLDREKLGYGHAVITSPDDPNGVAQVSCGRVAVSQWAAIVDPEAGEELPDGEVGEIWLHGANVGRGYWARPEETKHTFGNVLTTRLPAGSHAEGAPPEATWLRTGDLGVYLEGELYITGRIKDMIVLDGRNHYPQDIEATAAEASGAVRAGYVAAFAIGQDPTGEKLVIVAERAPGHGKADPDPVIHAVRRAVSRRHGINVFDVRLVAAGSIPRTTSGKLARRACRSEYLDRTLDTHHQAVSAPTSVSTA